MLTEKMGKALNDQINAELASAYIYYSMAAYFESVNLAGFAHWMNMQTLEEMTHAQKFVDYIHERGGRVQLAALEAPPVDWESPLAVFQAAYDHERYISKRIDDLVDLAIQERDHATNNFLQWFVEEQVEEEASADGVLQKLKLVEDSRGGLFMIDRELAQRTFTPPASGGE